MDKVTYFDVEYANSKNKAICQIGIVCENYNTLDPYYPELDIYINPEDGFDNNCIRIHGITASKVENEANFPTVWKEIEKYFTNAVVIGHNVASADLDALVKNLCRYNLDIPEIYYICTYELAKKYIPSYAIENYSMTALCEYFDIDMDSEHNAFDDACACSDLFKTLVRTYNIPVDSCVKRYIPKEIESAHNYIDNAVLRKSISDFYGIIRGFSIDNVISQEEIDFIKNWKTENEKYTNHSEIASIIISINNILKDGIVTVDEIITLQSSIESYLDVISTSPVTLATQILAGILKGITVDDEITEEECKKLRQWLYDNINLSDHYPFDKTIKVVDEILEDSIITKEESEYLMSVIDDLLNPVESLKEQVYSVEGKHICLSGDFSYGSKKDVERYIEKRGGIIDATVKKITDILIVGSYGSQAYANGNYGNKVKKAIEYNEKGCSISIVKENDFFSSIK